MPDIYYQKSKLPEEVAEDENRKSYATQDTYEGYLTKWILPRWKSYCLPDMKPVQVEQMAEVARSHTRQQGENRVAVSSAFKTGTRSSGDSEQRGMAYATTHVRHFDESKWRGHQDDSGVVTPFELQGDRRHLHTSRHSDEARCANKACQNESHADQAGRGKAGVWRVTFSYRTLSNPRRRGPIPINHLFCWRPRRDLNPCYRRERESVDCN